MNGVAAVPVGDSVKQHRRAAYMERTLRKPEAFNELARAMRASPNAAYFFAAL